jgi:hydroxymethylpyrimidine pyrophosphatase-like HAD family hydrolase|tara:strand:- start:252 stop:578 length:327 start_codon:yes stop_codon:yes gene_type:complete
MHYVFDIDGTICTHKSTGSPYEEASPIKERIDKINMLFDEGHRIIFHTARGMGTFKNDGKKAHDKYFWLTTDQLREWGVKYHQLIMGKPSGDLYVDDKGINDEEFFEY